MKRIIPIVILLAATVAAGVYYYPRLTNKSTPVNQITLSGNIEAHESLVGFKVQGRIVELPVEEGQQVAQGALLARPTWACAPPAWRSRWPEPVSRR